MPDLNRSRDQEMDVERNASNVSNTSDANKTQNETFDFGVIRFDQTQDNDTTSATETPSNDTKNASLNISIDINRTDQEEPTDKN